MVAEEPPAVRVADADRDCVLTLLREHCVAGRLTLEEFSDRTDRALEARTQPHLEAVTSDLPSAESSPEPKLGRQTVALVIGGLERRGRWRLPERLRAIGLIGGIELDLTDAVIETAEPTIEVWLVIGGIDVRVPEGIEVEVGGFRIIGGTENESPGRHIPGAPRVRLRQFGLIGGTSVTTRRA